MPSVCAVSPEQLQQPCVKCNRISWGPPELTDSLVFLPASAVQTQFESHSCGSANCNGKLEPDGKEVGLLRKTAKLAFAHELLYQWTDQMGVGTPDSWSGSWRSSLLQMHGLSRDTLGGYWSLKQAFSQATMDFIQLQNIDYATGFRCECCHGEVAPFCDVTFVA